MKVKLTPGRRRRLLPVAGLALIGLLGMSAPSTAAAQAAAPTFTAVGSVGQVYVTGLPPGAQATLVNPAAKKIATQNANSLGGLLFRNVPPGQGYRVQLAPNGPTSDPLTVHDAAAAPWNPETYNQSIPDNGYTYLTTRDGTKLAITVHPPTSPAGQPGAPSSIHLPTFPANTSYAPPYPTLIEYSGYGYADPAGPTSGIAVLANLMGFAVVDVNMRGTGCSGGAFDYFEPLQGLDGYDVIETVARQSWAARHQVGMMGISYGGISQLFVAATRPPNLSAIAPLSVIDDTATTLYPGGILNTGFALSWAKDRVHDAKPASATGGQAWALKRIRGGDRTCKANQALHAEAVDLLGKVRANSHYVPKVADPLAPVRFVHKIRVPTYLACQWTDEQTGGHCATLPPRFTGTSRKWFTFTNGTHIDSLDPATFVRWYDFLELYVAHRRPQLAPAVRGAAPTIFSAAMGVPGVTLPGDPIQAQPTYEAARAALPSQDSSAPSRASRCRGRGRGRGTSLPAGRSPTPRRPRRASTPSPGAGRRGRRRTSPATRPPVRTACGRRRPRTAGRRAPRARRCPT